MTPMILLIRMPAPTMNACRPVRSSWPLSVGRGKRPVLSPTTSIDSPAISDALRRPFRSRSKEAAGSESRSPEERRRPSGEFGKDSGFCSGASLIKAVVRLRQVPNVYSSKQEKTYSSFRSEIIALLRELQEGPGLDL